MSCKVFIISGKTGSGKSTISEMLKSQYGFPIVSFVNIGKTFARKHGKEHLRDCYKTLEPDEFKHSLVNDIKEIIDEPIKDNEVLILDGLYAYDAILNIQKKCAVVVIYLQVSDSVRYSRISKRLNVDIDSAIKEENLKEEIKKSLGNDLIIDMVDYSVDGNMPVEVVKDEVYKIILKELISGDKHLNR